MLNLKELTEINGFDTNNPDNASQNSYAWSMAELGDYIYVGTSRNMFSSLSNSFGKMPLPPSLLTGSDNNAEIWRYKKDDTCPWQKVFETSPYDESYGFRAMITHKSEYSYAIYAATMGKNIHLFKSTDGIHWLKIDTSNLVGTSSRSLASLNGNLYISTLGNGIGGNIPYLYSSCDPEYEPFFSVINTNSKNFIESQNPIGGIDNLIVFNNKLYVSIETDNGCEVWRSNSSYPSTNNWSLVADKGFGDSSNKNIMSSGIFNNKLYMAAAKFIPLSFFAPFGFDLIRIDKYDNWEIVVGGKPLIPSEPDTGTRNKSLSGFNSGFDNCFNVYGWQIKEFQNNLIVTTYDESTNITTLYNGFSYNKDKYINSIGRANYLTIIESYTEILQLLDKYKYPKGFDIYTSKDGCHFTPDILSGFNNPCNYGGRTLYVSHDNKLYLGTANPFYGCEVWRADSISYKHRCSKRRLISYFNTLDKLNSELKKIYPSLIDALQNMPVIQNSLN